MSGKVTGSQINMTTFQADEFRQAVNYTNPKNKGYVRFELNGQGGVKIAKVNNKVDLFINWRTNVDADKNKAMRAKFVDAITNNLRWADPSKVAAIAESIKTVAKGAHKGEMRTDALSRKELQAAFAKYDKLVNTPSGRREMIDNVLKDTAVKCGLGTTAAEIRELKNRFFPQAEDWSQLYALEHLKEGAQSGQPDCMEKSEAEFLSMLHTLELKCGDAIRRAQVENVVRSQATAFLAPGAVNNDFGLHLANDDKAQLRGGLLHFLKEKGYDVQGGVGNLPGTGGLVFNAFVDKVLPELFKKCIGDIKDAGGNVDLQLQMEANFSFDAILEEAERFLSGAKAYMDNPPKADGPKLTGNPAFDNIIKSGQQVVENAQGGVKGAYVRGGVEDVYKKSNMPKAVAHEMIRTLQQAGEVHDAEGLLATFTQKFLAERGIGDDILPSEEQDQIFKKTLDSIVDDTFKLGIGSQLQYGSAATQNKVRVAKDAGMGQYIADMESAIGQIVSGEKDVDAVGLMGKLMSCTLANIANRKVEMVANHVGTSLNLDKASEAEDKALVKNTVDAYLSFERTVLKTIAGARNAFEKTAGRLLKKGLITRQVFDETLQRAVARFANAHKAALHEFFVKSPVPSAEEGKKTLAQLFNAQLDVATADANNDLTIAAFARTLGAAQRRTLSSAAERVAEALAQTGLNDVKLARPGLGVDEQTARTLLKNGALKRLWTKTLTAHLKDVKSVNGLPTLTNDFVKKVVDDFNKKAVDLVKSTATQLDRFFAHCEKILKEQVTNIVDNESGALKGYVSGPTPITKDEKKQLVNDLTAETLRFKYATLRENALQILNAPESFAGKDLETLAKKGVDDFETGGVERTMNGLVKVVEDRQKMIDGFLDRKTGSMDDVHNHVAASGVFGKGGALEGAGQNEKWALVDAALKPVKARMKALPLVYATGDRSALVARISNEALKGAEKPLKEWMGFRNEFLKQCRAVEADFAGLGAEQIAAHRDWVLMEIFNGTAGAKRDVKLAIEYYRTSLSEELDAAVNHVKTKFSEYVAKVDKALAPAQAKFKEVMDSAVDELQFVMTPEARRYLEEKIVPQALRQMEQEVYRNPDLFAPGTQASKDYFAKLRTDFSENLYYIFDSVGLSGGGSGFSDVDKIANLVKLAGAQVLLTDPVESESAIADIKQWVNSDEGRTKFVACEKALLDYFAKFRSASLDFNRPELYGPQESGNPVAAFRTAAHDILKMHTAQLLYAPFDNARVGEAKEAFEKWVDSHGLSRFTGFNRTTTTKDLILVKFVERIKALQTSALEEGVNEPILTPAFIALIDQIIDTDGTTYMIGEWKQDVVQKLADHYLKVDDENAFLFNPDHPQTVAAGERVQAIARANREMILSSLGTRISSVAAGVDSADGMDHVRAALDQIELSDVVKAVNEEVILLVAQSIRRYGVATEVNRQYPNFSHAIERQLVKDVVGEEQAAYFPNGLNDLLTANADDTLVKAVGEAKKWIAAFLDGASDYCYEKDDMTSQGVVSIFRNYANSCIEEMKKKEWWLSGFFTKSGLSVAIRNAAAEKARAEAATAIK